VTLGDRSNVAVDEIADFTVSRSTCYNPRVSHAVPKRIPETGERSLPGACGNVQDGTAEDLDANRMVAAMGESESEYLLKLWEQNICPYCGQTIPEGQRTGSGSKAKGGFCSLDCYTRYYALELAERARRRQRSV
jgi:hypothetical protein